MIYLKYRCFDILIRPFTLSDYRQIGELFYDTVHTVNRIDYNQVQLNAWAPRRNSIDFWKRIMLMLLF